MTTVSPPCKTFDDFNLVGRANADRYFRFVGDVLLVDDHHRSFVGITGFECHRRSRHDDRVVFGIRKDRDLRRAIRAQLPVAIAQRYPNFNGAIGWIAGTAQQT